MSRTRISVHPRLPSGLGDNVLFYHSCPEEDKDEQDKDICTSSAAHRFGRQCETYHSCPIEDKGEQDKDIC